MKPETGVRAPSDDRPLPPATPKGVLRIDPEISDLLPGFHRNRMADVALMRSALDDGALEPVRRLAHGSKGSGAAYGFPEITRLSGVIEQCAVSGDVDGARAAVSELSVYLTTVEIEVDGVQTRFADYTADTTRPR